MIDKMKIPDISIILPLYDRKKDLKRAIDSVLVQTLESFELIIINYESTDIMHILESYKDSRIKLINTEQDYVKSLNIGISLAIGKYVIPMDVDHLMIHNRLEKQFEFMEKHQEVDVCGGWTLLFGEKNDIIKKNKGHEKIILKALYENPVVYSTVMFRTNLRKLFFFNQEVYEVYQKNYHYAEDYKLWTDLITKGCRFENIPVILLKHRCTESQLTTFYKKNQALSTIKIQAEYINSVMNMIVKSDNVFFDIINKHLKLYIKNKITFKSFRNIIYCLGKTLGCNLISK